MAKKKGQKEKTMTQNLVVLSMFFDYYKTLHVMYQRCQQLSC